MTPLDLAFALEEIRAELNRDALTWQHIQHCLVALSERPDILASIINRLDLSMHASPAYVAKVRCPVAPGDQTTALGILQGRGVKAQDVTSAHVIRAVRDYRQRLEAEISRRKAAGIPLRSANELPTPDQLAPPASAFKPPWED